MLNKLNERKAELLKQIKALQAEVVAVETQIKEEETKQAEQAVQFTKVEKKPSPTIQALNGVKELLQVKYPDADIKKPVYYQEGDIHSTAHYYSLTSKMASGSILTLGVTVTYIPYSGATHEFTVTIEKNNQTLKHARLNVNKSDITTQGIKNMLASNFKICL